MDLEFIRQLIAPFVTLTTYIIVSGVGVSAVTQAMKDYRFPIPVERHPRISSAVLSVVATLISLYAGDVNVLLSSVGHWIGFAVSIILASAFSYNILFKGLRVPPAE